MVHMVKSCQQWRDLRPQGKRYVHTAQEDSFYRHEVVT